MMLSAEQAPLDVIQAARMGMNQMVSSHTLPPDARARISAESGFSGMELKQAFRMHTVSPLNLAQCPGLDTIVEQMPVWRFVMASEGKPVSLMTVAQIDGQWKAVSIGGAGLAGEVAKVMELWPAAEGFSHRFVRVFQARADLIEISKNGELMGFVPLSSSRIALELGGAFEARVLLRNSEVVTPLRDVVHRNLRQAHNRPEAR